MGGSTTELTGPDFARGVAIADIPDGGLVAGHAGGEAVLVARRGPAIYAVGATCTHYGAPLSGGLLVDGTVRCPWHHACFDLASGAALGPPALNALACWDVVRDGDLVRLGGKREPATVPHTVTEPAGGVIVLGGGAAAQVAVETMRASGYAGAITILSADTVGPVDRPNLSKDYLAGTAPEEWIPLRGPEWYAEHAVRLVLGRRASSLDPAGKRVILDGGEAIAYGALILATGATPLALDAPGADLPHVHTLRSLADSRAIAARAQAGAKAVVVGSGFIGLEVAAALRTRGVDVTVVSRGRPLERVMGPHVGAMLEKLHESHGVAFRLGETVKRVEAHRLTLASGATLDADLVVVGLGVRPADELARAAGLQVDSGVLVDAELATSAPGVWAAGDVARFPDARSGRAVRVEHWSVAEKMGQVAARNALGAKQRFTSVPFFWSQHYDLAINYVGHADRWDLVDIHGDLDARDATIVFREAGRILAVATLGRDRVSLEAEAAMERGDDVALERIVG